MTSTLSDPASGPSRPDNKSSLPSPYVCSPTWLSLLPSSVLRSCFGDSPPSEKCLNALLHHFYVLLSSFPTVTDAYSALSQPKSSEIAMVRAEVREWKNGLEKEDKKIVNVVVREDVEMNLPIVVVKVVGEPDMVIRIGGKYGTGGRGIRGLGWKGYGPQRGAIVYVRAKCSENRWNVSVKDVCQLWLDAVKEAFRKSKHGNTDRKKEDALVDNVKPPTAKSRAQLEWMNKFEDQWAVLKRVRDVEEKKDEEREMKRRSQMTQERQERERQERDRREKAALAADQFKSTHYSRKGFSNRKPLQLSGEEPQLTGRASDEIAEGERPLKRAKTNVPTTGNPETEN